MQGWRLHISAQSSLPWWFWPAEEKAHRSYSQCRSSSLKSGSRVSVNRGASGGCRQGVSSWRHEWINEVTSAHLFSRGASTTGFALALQRADPGPVCSTTRFEADDASEMALRARCAPGSEAAVAGSAGGGPNSSNGPRGRTRRWETRRCMGSDVS